MPAKEISRRDFLKLGTLSAGAVLLAGCEGQVATVSKVSTVILKATATLFQRTPTPEPSSTGTPIPSEISVTPLPKEPTTEPTEEKPKEVTTTARVDIYDSTEGGSPGGYILANREIPITRWIEINGVWWAELPGGKWAKESGAGGLFPPPTTPEAPQGRFAKEIVMANGQLDIHNMGTNWGLRVSQYAKGPDGKLIMGQGGRDINIGKIETMFTKYSGGRKLRIYFYDSFEEFDKVAQGRGKKSDAHYRFGQRGSDGVAELFIGVYPDFASKGDYANDIILFEVNYLGVAVFLLGREDVVIDNVLGPALPEDLQKNLVFPAVFTVYP